MRYGSLIGILFFSLVIFTHFSFAQNLDCKVSELTVVKFNERNESVKKLQECLISLGFNIPYGPTGYYGFQTKKAVKEFYQSLVKINVSGNVFGFTGINYLRKLISSVEISKGGLFFKKVSSKEELIYYLNKSNERGLPILMLTGRLEPIPLALETPQLKAEPSRISETTVQVKGIDEPDIVKTDGKNIYFSQRRIYYILPFPPSKPLEKETTPPQYKEPKTKIVKSFPVEDLQLLNEIDETGELLLLKDKKILVIFTPNSISGYDVSDAKNPKKIWNFKYENNFNLLNARLYQNKIYFILKQYIDFREPCPIRPLSSKDTSIIIPCLDIYRPAKFIPADSQFIAFILNPENGEIEKKLSFIGSSSDSILYMSKNNLYVAYFFNEELMKILSDFYANELVDLLPNDLIEKIRKIIGYEISEEGKQFEINKILDDYLKKLTPDENMKVKNEFENRKAKYLKTKIKEIEKTAIIKIDLNNFEIKNTGYIPGYLLNQFALDESNDYLRTAVTIGQRTLGRDASSNSIYILDSNLNIIGKVEELGLTERIYSVRFINDKGYLVTFRETDPFYVLDLSQPRNPKLKGELKIPGFSSYLEPLAEDKILGVGREDSKVKVSIFDVSNPEKPIEKDKYIIDDSYSEVLSNHHAFLKDDKHQVFFLPGSKGGYIFSYKDDKLTLKLTISGFEVKRAVYIEDYLYILSEDKLTVFNEINWEKVKEIEL